MKCNCLIIALLTMESHLNCLSARQIATRDPEYKNNQLLTLRIDNLANLHIVENLKLSETCATCTTTFFRTARIRGSTPCKHAPPAIFCQPLISSRPSSLGVVRHSCVAVLRGERTLEACIARSQPELVYYRVNCPKCDFVWEHSGQKILYQMGSIVGRSTVPCIGPPSAFPMDRLQFENRFNMDLSRQHQTQAGLTTVPLPRLMTGGNPHNWQPRDQASNQQNGTNQYPDTRAGQFRGQTGAVSTQQNRTNQHPPPSMSRQAEQSRIQLNMGSSDIATMTEALGRDLVPLVAYETPAAGSGAPSMLVNYTIAATSHQLVQTGQASNQDVGLPTLGSMPSAKQEIQPRIVDARLRSSRWRTKMTAMKMKPKVPQEPTMIRKMRRARKPLEVGSCRWTEPLKIVNYLLSSWG